MIEVEGLTRDFSTGFVRKHHSVAVDDVSFGIRKGETLGLIGESGSGKTTLGKLLLRLLEPTSGRLFFEGSDIFALSGKELRRLRPRMQMIFQDPNGSLNSRMTTRESIAEPLRLMGMTGRREISAEVGRLVEKVGLGPEHLNRRPGELSGGQNQRIALARVLALSPAFIVADEPTSALDASIQAQMLEIMTDLKREMGLTYLFISHDLRVVRHMSDRVAVMCRGRIVEIGDTEDVFRHPVHPYTRGFLAGNHEGNRGKRRVPMIESVASEPGGGTPE